jgi:hypothetical protein
MCLHMSDNLLNSTIIQAQNLISEEMWKMEFEVWTIMGHTQWGPSGLIGFIT